MTTDSQNKRYRDGYAAGRRDGTAHAADADESLKRSLTGDDWADDSYMEGFSEGRHILRFQAFSGLGRVLKDMLWVPQITGWLRRLAASH